ncbi:hypothetical protein J4Q44_G00068590 [Coregonus suidteri]|uniref:Uncharacterized protein n=1 Tax=Coregonus suidteri TaxID=861788 RepID=A0AAN8M7T1_9TELE
MNVRVDYDLKDQRISVTWEDDPSSSRVADKLIYDVEVLITHNMKEVHNSAPPTQSGSAPDTRTTPVNGAPTEHHWDSLIITSTGLPKEQSGSSR